MASQGGVFLLGQGNKYPMLRPTGRCIIRKYTYAIKGSNKTELRLEVNEFKLQEKPKSSSLPMPVLIYEGCSVCIITIRCEHEIQGPNIHLKSDLETCSKEPAQRVDVQLSNSLHALFNDFPELDSSPHQPDITTARVTLFQVVEKQIIRLPEVIQCNLEP